MTTLKRNPTRNCRALTFDLLEEFRRWVFFFAEKALLLLKCDRTCVLTETCWSALGGLWQAALLLRYILYVQKSTSTK